MKSDRKTIVVLTGAGISQESGLKTFRDADGLWEGQSVYDVATPEGFRRNPDRVYDFYNQRRQQLRHVQPNAAHFALRELEEAGHRVTIITQNVDDLHERAGSSEVLHLHGEILKARSLADPELVIPWEGDLNAESTGPDGEGLRPHVVWFGEDVPLIPKAAEICTEAEVLIIVGTSLAVYPAANLWMFAPGESIKYYIDPKPAEEASRIEGLHIIAEKAAVGVPFLVKEFLNI